MPVRCGLGQSVAIGIELNQFPGGDQLLKMGLEIFARLSVQAKFAHELLESRSALGLAGNVFQDGGVGEHERRSSLAESSSQFTFNPNVNGSGESLADDH